ncbi:serine/threonine-protein kinase [Actinomadura sp. 6K520]|uniref:serine/threonine-protein kinase n=1 Tax=Actinomadura sp. 6K520 TaxID=2530364 RepID=UPI0010432DF3|nr:serine/threonine-protein kinase [Actinomadura sp. 6K520]TDE26557.1 serine/threonine protein kinase [Actinomadura sp. 6K520]
MTSADTDDAALPGRRVGPYRLVRELGRGGMGTVHLAETPDGRRVAIKIINREMTGTPDFRERFRREVTAARQVHPFCTAPVLDAKMDGEPFYVVTEYVQGPTLERVVSTHGRLGGSDLDGLAVGVATALAAIHSAGVVHRDLKPENILLSPFGPRVIDFGIARRLGTDHRLTRAGQSMGTPAFMAPEGLVDRPITAAADVFSWGSVMAYAGTGRLPFHGENVGEVLYKTVYGEPRLDGLKPPLRDLVARALAKDPEARPTAAQLLQELTGQSDTERAARSVGMVGPTVPEIPAGTSLPPASDGRTRYFSDRRMSRHRLVLAVGIIAALAVAGGLVAFLRPDLGGGDSGSLLSDDFSDPDSGWKTGRANREYEEYRDGAFAISQYGTGFYQLQQAPVADPPKNVKVTVTVRIQSANSEDEAGVYCRSSGEAQYAVLVKRNGQARIRKGGPISGSELAKSALPSTGNAVAGAQVGAICVDTGEGVTIKALVDGREVAQATDTISPLLGGTTGIIAGREGRLGTDPGTQVTFDDFSLAPA